MNPLRLATALLVLLLIGAAPATQPASPARTAYARLLALSGEWEGKSSKGWTEKLSITPIAKQSAVMEVSKFAHGDDDAMVTMYSLDGENLMLTHYCMAKNQPRLKATEISDDGKSVTFTFLDGTNMASRDVGHMDKVRINFEDDNHFKSQWTFYADGKEKWMEAITYNRITKPASK